MKFLFAILISLMSVTMTSAAERIYATEPGRYGKGALSLEEDCTPALTELLQSRKEEPCAKLSAGTLSKISGSVILTMSEVKHQKSVGACSAFALIACCEYLYPGQKFSEAELYMRAKTSKFSRRETNGSSLLSYLQILEEGLIEDQYFIPYHFYEAYVAKRDQIKKCREKGEDLPVGMHGKFWWEKPKNRPPVFGDFATHSMSTDYAESIQEFKHWAVINSTRLGEIPPIVKPCWRVEKGWANCSTAMTCELDRSCNNILAAEGVNPCTRKVVTPAIVLPASREYLGKDAYFRGVKAYRLTPQNVNELKTILADGFPVAIIVDTFVEFKITTDENGQPQKVKTIDFWLNEEYLKSIDYKLDMPDKEHLPTDVEADGAHAICLCGYDDAKGAFKFKNSWGTDWGDQGYAWISYDYIKNHSIKYGAVYVTKN